MYLDFYNFKHKPFDLVPNPDFIFLSKTHKKAIVYLDHGIRERAGFILLTGEVGSGKTTIIRELIQHHLENVILSKIFNTNVTSEQLLSLINDDFDLPVQGKDKLALLRDLNNFLVEQYAKGKRPVIIIDEAQNLSLETLEELRMLSNLETGDTKLMQIILVGQPELRDLLAKTELRQLRQRISIQCHIQPLDHLEIEQYISHRMEIAGNRKALIFAPEAISIIDKYSRGIPRLINIICDFILLSAFAEGVNEISRELVCEIIGDLDFNKNYWADDLVLASTVSDRDILEEDSKIKKDRIEVLLEGICLRLEQFENDSAFATNTAVSALSDRVDKLQNMFSDQVNKTNAAVAELPQKNELPIQEQLVTVNENQLKAGFFQRFFG